MYKPSKVFVAFAWIVLATAFCMMGWFAFDSFWPPKLVTFSDGMILIARDFTKCETPIHVFRPGDIVPLRFRGYKYTDDVPEIFTRMINDSVVTLPSVYTAKEMGPFNFVSLSRKIPIDSHAGIFFFEITYVYHRNFIRSSETYKVRTEPFRIEVSKTSHHDRELDEMLVRRVLRELSMQMKKDWDEYRRQKFQFEEDRRRFEESKKHGK